MPRRRRNSRNRSSENSNSRFSITGITASRSPQRCRVHVKAGRQALDREYVTPKGEPTEFRFETEDINNVASRRRRRTRRRQHRSLGSQSQFESRQRTSPRRHSFRPERRQQQSKRKTRSSRTNRHSDDSSDRTATEQNTTALNSSSPIASRTRSQTHKKSSERSRSSSPTSSSETSPKTPATYSTSTSNNESKRNVKSNRSRASNNRQTNQNEAREVSSTPDRILQNSDSNLTDEEPAEEATIEGRGFIEKPRSKSIKSNDSKSSSKSTNMRDAKIKGKDVGDHSTMETETTSFSRKYKRIDGNFLSHRELNDSNIGIVPDSSPISSLVTSSSDSWSSSTDVDNQSTKTFPFGTTTTQVETVPQIITGPTETPSSPSHGTPFLILLVVLAFTQIVIESQGYLDVCEVLGEFEKDYLFTILMHIFMPVMISTACCFIIHPKDLTRLTKSFSLTALVMANYVLLRAYQCREGTRNDILIKYTCTAQLLYGLLGLYCQSPGKTIQDSFWERLTVSASPWLFISPTLSLIYCDCQRNQAMVLYGGVIYVIGMYVWISTKIERSGRPGNITEELRFRDGTVLRIPSIKCRYPNLLGVILISIGSTFIEVSLVTVVCWILVFVFLKYRATKLDRFLESLDANAFEKLTVRTNNPLLPWRI